MNSGCTSRTTEKGLRSTLTEATRISDCWECRSGCVSCAGRSPSTARLAMDFESTSGYPLKWLKQKTTATKTPLLHAGLQMNRFRALELDPYHAFAQAIEHRLALGCEDFRVPEPMLEFTTQRTPVANVDLAAKAAVDREGLGGNGPAVPSHLTRECHVLSPLLYDRTVAPC